MAFLAVVNGNAKILKIPPKNKNGEKKRNSNPLMFL
jgi:hypothetical protein